MKAALDEQKVNVRVKLAALWTSFMFFYIYVDYLHLYMPDMLETLMSGKVFTFDITQAFLTTALVSVTIPALMIFLSLSLPAKIGRWANISLGVIYIPYSIFNLVGEAWVHMYYAAIVEVVLLALIVRYALKWPTAQK